MYVDPFSKDFLKLKCINYAIHGPRLLNSVDLQMFVKASETAPAL